MAATNLGIIQGTCPKYWYKFLSGANAHQMVMFEMSGVSTQMADVNLDTGVAAVISNAATGWISGIIPAYLHSNGQMWIGLTDGTDAKGSVWRYSPATQAVVNIGGAAFKVLAGKYCNRFGETTGGLLLVGEMKVGGLKAILEWYDPVGDTWSKLGATGEITNSAGGVNHLTGDATYAHVSLGESLTSINLSTTDEYPYWSGLTTLILYSNANGNCYAQVAPAQAGSTYFLLHGDSVEGIAGLPAGCVRQDYYIPWRGTAPTYTVDKSNTVPDSAGAISFRWQKPGSGTWYTAAATVTLENYDIARMHINQTGGILGCLLYYGPFFTHSGAVSGATQKGWPRWVVNPGDLDEYTALSNVYAIGWDPFRQRWIMGGYDHGCFDYDPTATWTANPETEMDASNPEYFSFGTNSYWYWFAMGVNRVAYLFSSDDTIAKYGTPGSNPTEIVTFTGADEITSIAPIRGNTRIAVSLAKTNDGSIKLFNPRNDTVGQAFTPYPGETYQGAIIEAANRKQFNIATMEAALGVTIKSLLGKLICFVKGANSKAKCIDTYTGAVVWSQTYNGLYGLGTLSYYNYELVRGPDGFIWLYMGTSIYKIHPNTGAATEVLTAAAGAPNPGRLLWSLTGDVLYVYSGTDKKLWSIPKADLGL